MSETFLNTLHNSWKQYSLSVYLYKISICNIVRWYRALNALKAMHTMQKLTFPETVPGTKIYIFFSLLEKGENFIWSDICIIWLQKRCRNYSVFKKEGKENICFLNTLYVECFLYKQHYSTHCTQTSSLIYNLYFELRKPS